VFDKHGVEGGMGKGVGLFTKLGGWHDARALRAVGYGLLRSLYGLMLRLRLDVQRPITNFDTKN